MPLCVQLVLVTQWYNKVYTGCLLWRGVVLDKFWLSFKLTHLEKETSRHIESRKRDRTMKTCLLAKPFCEDLGDGMGKKMEHRRASGVLS